MRRRSVVTLVSVLTIAASAAGYGFFGQRSAPAPLALSAPAIGREAVLHVRWHESSTARLPAGQTGGDGTMTGELDLEADLALSRERTTDGADAIRAELRDVRGSRVMVSGQKVLDTDGKKMLENKPIHLVVEDGRLSRVLVDRDASSLAVQLTESVARQVLVPIAEAGDKAFERDEETTAGKVHVRYEPRAGKRETYARTVTGAIALTNLPDACEAPSCTVRARSEGEVRFDRGDAIAFISDRREIHAGKSGAPAMLDTTATFEAERVREGDVAVVAIDTAALASKLPGEAFESAADHKASLARLAAGATIENVVDGVSQSAASGSRGLAKGWLVRSSAFLELHPEAVDEIAARFADEGLGNNGRLALLDLLAATGGNAAERALLRSLDTAAAREGESRLAFVQRLMLVESPSESTSRAVRDRLARSQGAGDADMAYAEAHVLGSIASRLAAHGAKGEAKAASDVLAGSLDRAKSPAEASAYLTALGNAGDPRQVDRIAKHARDTDPGVRRSVAAALRKTDEPEARRTLVGLAKDSDPEVQVEALRSISTHPVEADEQRDLAQLLDTPQLGGEAEAQLTTLLLRQGPPSPEVRGSLEHLLARTEDPRLAARIRFAIATN